MTGDLSIRPYRDADFAAVADLWERCGLTVSYNPPEKDIALCLATPSSELFVGEFEAGLAATVMAGSDGHRGWLYYVAVDPAHRKHGYGRRLVRYAEDWLSAQGVRKVQIMIRETNLDVRSFYDRIGYEANPCPVMQRWLVDRHAP